jgi:hypothetical protein
LSKLYGKAIINNILNVRIMAYIVYIEQNEYQRNIEAFDKQEDAVKYCKQIEKVFEVTNQLLEQEKEWQVGYDELEIQY